MTTFVDFLREHGGLLSYDFMAKLDAAIAGGGGGGTVTGPGTSSNGEIPLFSGTSGNILKNSNVVPSANVLSFLGAADYGTMKTLMGLGPFASYDAGTMLEYVQDTAGAMMVAGANMTVFYDDTAGTVTFAASLAGGTVTGAGASTNGELVLFSGTSGAALLRSNIVPSANGLSLIAAANYAAMTTLLGLGALAFLNTITASLISDPQNVKTLESLILAISDETTALTTGTAKLTFRMPYAFTLSDVRASLTTASTSGIPTFDINESGTTILSTKLTIDVSEKTSVTAINPPTISDPNLADDAEMTIDIDVAGTGAKGAKIYLIGSRA